MPNNLIDATFLEQRIRIECSVHRERYRARQAMAFQSKRQGTMMCECCRQLLKDILCRLEISVESVPVVAGRP